MKVTITWTNPNPETVWNRLAKKLGREPTTQEATAAVKSILATVPGDDLHAILNAPGHPDRDAALDEYEKRDAEEHAAGNLRAN